MTTPNGFGICGHKNSFSTGIKIGNYVEDRFGKQLAVNMKTHPIAAKSEASASFIDPRDMDDKCSANAPPENAIERDGLRAGLPYNLLFEHGKPHLATRDELTTKYTPSSTEIGQGVTGNGKPITLHQQGTLRRQRDLKQAQDAREARHQYVTTSQSLVPATIRAGTHK